MLSIIPFIGGYCYGLSLNTYNADIVNQTIDIPFLTTIDAVLQVINFINFVNLNWQNLIVALHMIKNKLQNVLKKMIASILKKIWLQKK
jgi:hypothetical protein